MPELRHSSVAMNEISQSARLFLAVNGGWLAGFFHSLRQFAFMTPFL